ncbi:MAG: hypothetical protein QGG71_17940 [Pirellulaceae bacterium]|jgi:hypothetical protein|nr:hypothetical protein [Pirellulaceae bacterium]
MLKVCFIFLAMLLMAGSTQGQQAASQGAGGDDSLAKRSYSDWSKFDPANFDPEHTYSFQVGDIRVVIGDHYAHGGTDRPSYTGIHHLSHKLRESNVFCPLYAGMIGIRRQSRIAPAGDNGAVIWVGEGQSKISEEYIVRPPHYIDHTARFTAGAQTGAWNNTSYMNGPGDPGIYLLGADGTWVRHYSEKHGHAASVAPATMDQLPTVNKVDDSPYPHGGAGFHEGFSEVRFDPNYALFFGRFDDMVLVYMIERRWGRDLLPYMSPTGGGYSKESDRSNPAWDYRYWLRELTPDQEVIIRTRVVYKLWAGAQDVLQEYDSWHKELSARQKH